MKRHDALATTFAACRSQKRSALITYVMAGDPSPSGALAMAMACVEGGADILEIGMPFSDPIADGPTIQRAAMRSLAHGTTVEDCLALAQKVRRKTDVPIALMGYLNPVLALGERRFLRGCAEAGVDAVILPDLPPEEAGSFRTEADKQAIRTVFLAAPTSTEARLEAVTRASTGFVYFVSVTGVTGGKRASATELAPRLRALRATSGVPVVVGFGVSTPEQARSLGRIADGVVVGSAIVQEIAGQGTVESRAKRVRGLVRRLRQALD